MSRIAAQLAIDTIRRDLENLPERSPDVALRSAILEANRIIVLRRQNQAFAQMGTTIVAVIFHEREVVVGHVGDSRAYLIRDGNIQQLTTDHTYVQQLVERGQIRPEDALSHPQAHILTRAIGSEPGLEVDIKNFWLWEAPPGVPQDSLLICSDGLYSLIRDDEIAQIAATNTPQVACAQLVELGRSRGGFDNITVAIVPLRGELRQEPPPGYREELSRRTSARGFGPVAPDGRSLGRLVIMMGVLSVLAALLTVFAMLVFVGR